MRLRGLFLIGFVCLLTGVCHAVVVPSCVGMAQADADSLIASLGLSPSDTYDYNLANAGTVYAQSPSAGLDVLPGSVVTLNVSEGVLSPEAYNYQGLLYGLMGIVGVYLFWAGFRAGLAF